MVHLILEIMNNKKIIWSNQHSFSKGLSYLSNLLNFQSEMAGL